MAAEELARLNAALQAELVAVKAETSAKVATLEDTIANLAHEIALLQRRLYGNKTERSHTAEAQLALGELLAGEAALQRELDDAIAKAKDAVEPEPEPATGERNGTKPKGRRDLSTSKLPRVLVEILDEEREAGGCRRIGFEDSRQLMFRRGGFAVLVKRVAKYEVIENGEATVVVVPSPETLFPRALLHTSRGRACDHVEVRARRAALPARARPRAPGRAARSRHHEPVRRTCRQRARRDDRPRNVGRRADPCAGDLDRRDRRVDPACEDQGRPATGVQAWALLHSGRRLRRGPVRVYRGAHQRVRAGPVSATSAATCRPTRATCTISSRTVRPKIARTACGSSGALRTFDGISSKPPSAATPVGLQGLLRIRAIYAADRVVQRAPAADYTMLRGQHVRPLVDDFFAWVQATKPVTAGRNLATKALGYATNQEAELRRVLENAKLPLDNTRAERALRKIVVGRKAWMFYGSDTHAEAAAAIFSVIASCRLHGLDPFQYLEEVLRVLPYWPRDRYLELAPKYWRATRGRLRPDELASPISAFVVPPTTGEAAESVAAPSA